MTLPEQILQIVSELTHHPIALDTDLHQLGDGLKFLEIILSIEDEFDIWISDDQAESVKTVADLIALVGGKIGVVA